MTATVPTQTEAARVLVVVLGGTITMTNDDAGLSPKIVGTSLVQELSRFLTSVDVTVTTPQLIASPSLSFSDIQQVSRLLDESFAANEIHGAVVVQGTDTIEESSFLLHLLLKTSRPVVVTGAMRGADAPGGDGPANLLAAIQVAASPYSDGLGVLVVVNDEIHSAETVVKGHTSKPSAFNSPGWGPLGLVVEGRVAFLQVPNRTTGNLGLEPTELDVPVALIKASMSDDERLLSALPNLGYQGAVIEAMGGGHMPERFVVTVERLCKAMPVLMSSRTGAGSVMHRTYGYPGSEIDLIQRGVLPTGFLSGLKARMVLMAALSCGADRETIRNVLSRWI